MGEFLLSPRKFAISDPGTASTVAPAPRPPPPPSHAELLCDGIAAFAPNMPPLLKWSGIQWLLSDRVYEYANRQVHFAAVIMSPAGTSGCAAGGHFRHVACKTVTQPIPEKQLEMLRAAVEAAGAGGYAAGCGAAAATTCSRPQLLAALPPHVMALAREPVCNSLVAERLRAVHGPAAAERSMSTILGWGMEEVAGVAGLPAAFRMVTYSEWLENGSLRDYLVKLFAPAMLVKASAQSQLQPDGERYAKTLLALLEVVDLLVLLSRAGVVLGDLKLENLLVDSAGHVKLTDLDGASLLPLEDVQAAAAKAQAMEAATAALLGGAGSPAASAAAGSSGCPGLNALWLALDQQPAPAAPSMLTPAFAPPEMMLAAPAQPYMTAQSHVYLVGASLEYVLTQLLDEALAPSRQVAAGRLRDLEFVGELRELARGMQAQDAAKRPAAHTLRQQLQEMQARW
ncbi:hypothetical protein HYH02_006800 [Chlamydomonas schloesseri]|uniref:Protein kinase domain-containing protein n=1 Tax=Chlamydomonas schloesseri TaxID=2026947 RepID=A0A835WJX6_9CHLO|nr:hypothetical protein HYH02_006800 [Chlamydomonas schloesseri]|eukprot:KAG2448215.1 hypothetical protein HYH02_006800 [Chlamydomonas schloesseri]